MVKKRVSFCLDDETIQLIRTISKQKDIKQNSLIKDALQCYLILNAKDQKEEK